MRRKVVTFRLTTDGSNDGYASFYTGHFADSRQLLLVPTSVAVVAVSFDRDGRLAESVSRPCQRDEPEAADQYTARQISACLGWREELGVTPGKIEVAEFELTPPLPFVCLEQFDDWMWEVLHGWDEADGATEEEQRRRDSVRSWQEERCCILHIEGEKYYIQSGGESVSS